MKGVHMSIHQNNSVSCGVREEGCRAMAKRQGHLEWLHCIILVNKVKITKLD